VVDETMKSKAIKAQEVEERANKFRSLSLEQRLKLVKSRRGENKKEIAKITRLIKEAKKSAS
jgi:predicted nucleotidyltransferase